MTRSLRSSLGLAISCCGLLLGSSVDAAATGPAPRPATKADVDPSARAHDKKHRQIQKRVTALETSVKDKASKQSLESVRKDEKSHTKFVLEQIAALKKELAKLGKDIQATKKDVGSHRDDFGDHTNDAWIRVEADDLVVSQTKLAYSVYFSNRNTHGVCSLPYHPPGKYKVEVTCRPIGTVHLPHGARMFSLKCDTAGWAYLYAYSSDGTKKVVGTGHIVDNEKYRYRLLVTIKWDAGKKWGSLYSPKFGGCKFGYQPKGSPRIQK